MALLLVSDFVVTKLVTEPLALVSEVMVTEPVTKPLAPVSEVVVTNQEASFLFLFLR